MSDPFPGTEYPEKMTMQDQVFQDRLKEMVGQIDSLPESEQAALRELVAQTQARRESMQQNFGRIRESVNDLQMQVKYLTFDLEATRRERDELS